MSLTRDEQTMRIMVQVYCRKHHGSSTSLCPDCQQLQDYAEKRLARCPYGADKPACSACPIHCYQPKMREQMQAVMRFAGPRMFVQHPRLALAHLVTNRQRPAAGDPTAKGQKRV